jgi:pimeloyl-ACP methyl ester carboxylesterase
MLLPVIAGLFTFTAHPCPASDALAHAVCGSVAVPENYAKSGSREIRLNVVIFPATASGRGKAAQFDLEGGPGFAVTDSAAFYGTDGTSYHEFRDVVLFDMRGTGDSNPLRCPAIEDRVRAAPEAPMYPPDLVADCARSLAATADLAQYGTANAARDIDAVRAALGYERIDLNAASYGTTLALRYIQDYPDRVRSAVLQGAAPADRTPPAHHAVGAERGLNLLFDACTADAGCAKQYPNLRAELAAATRRLDPERRAVFLEKLRTRLDFPATARGVPKAIHDAATGTAVKVPSSSLGGRVFADGLYLSITCAESLARMDVARAIAESDATVFGSYRMQRQRDACARWPAAPSDPDLFRKESRDVPVLFLSAALDPVTPPDWAAETAKKFPNGRQVVVPEGAHGFDGLTGVDTCIDAIVLKFVETLAPAKLDVSCVAGMRREGFEPPQ